MWWGTITASAETVSEAVSFGNGTLRIGRLRSAASATIDTTGKLTTVADVPARGAHEQLHRGLKVLVPEPRIVVHQAEPIIDGACRTPGQCLDGHGAVF